MPRLLLVSHPSPIFFALPGAKIFSALPKCSLLQAITEAPSSRDARFVFLFFNLLDFAIDPNNLNRATPPSGKILNLICVKFFIIYSKKVMAISFCFFFRK